MNAGWLNLASLLLGLAAWALPGIAFIRRRQTAIFAAASFCACALSLWLQILYTEHLVNKSDWSALMDTSHAVSVVSGILLVVTLLLNVLALAADARAARQK